MAFKGMRDTMRRAPLLTISAIVIFVGLIVYAILRGTGGNASPTTANLPIATPLGPSVIFTSPVDGASIANPVDVKMAIGGLRFEAARDPVKPGYGHLGLIVDGESPVAGATFAADTTHLDLSDASHEVTLETLSPGDHKLTAVFMNSADVIYAPLIAATIGITVTDASPTPS